VDLTDSYVTVKVTGNIINDYVNSTGSYIRGGVS
jgi:hypothetical protein